MKKIVFISFLLLLGIISYAQVPSDHMILWVRSDSVEVIDDKVETWYDLSGNDYHLQQASSALRPAFIDSVLNNYPSVTFNGVNNFLQVNFGQAYNQPNSVFVIWKANSAPGVPFDNISSRHYLAINADSDITLNASSNPTTTVKYSKTLPMEYVINTCYYNGADSKLFENSVLKSSGNAGNLSIEGLMVGSIFSGGAYLNGDILEIIAYDTTLIDSDRALVENYLMDRYAPPLSLGEDINMYGFCDTALIIDESFTDILWSTGETNDTIYVDETGEYTVQAIDIFGRMQYGSISISYPHPEFSDTTICLGDSVSYSVDLPGPYDYLWSQGGTDSLIWIKDEGTYSVQITDTNGCFITREFFVDVDSFINHVSLGPDPELCSGNSISLISGEEECVSFLWNPGENTTPDQVVNTSGWQKLTVQNDIGCEAIDSVYVTITGTAPTPAYTVEHLCFGDNTLFTDNSTSPETITAWTWVFNENDSIHTESAEWAFETPGTQNVELIVSSESGCANSLEFEIDILEIPTVNYSYNPVCSGVEINFLSDISIPAGTSITNYNWILDESPAGTGSSLNYTFPGEGEYSLNLTVELDNGCTSSYEETINVADSYPFPEYLSLVNPSDNAVLNPGSTTDFQWNNAAYSINYALILSEDETFENVIATYPEITDTDISVDLPETFDTLFWKVIAYNPCMLETETTVRKIYGFSPVNFENCKLWLPGDSVETTANMVDIWFDQSGNENHLTQATGTEKPISEISILNEHKTLNFDGVNDNISASFGEELAQPNTTFVVWKSNELNGVAFDNSVSRHYLAINASSEITINASPDPTSPVKYEISQPMPFLLSTCVFNSSSSEIYGNSILRDSGDAGALSMEGIVAGSIFSGGAYLDGSIAEILIYNDLLEVNERTQIETYLYNKYSPPVNLGFDIQVPYGFCDTTITTADKPWFTEFLWSTGDTTSTISTNHNGEYSVTVTDIFGFTSTDDIRVEFPKVHQADMLSMVCDGDTLSWDSGLPTDNYTFNWMNSVSTSPVGQYWTNTQAALQITDTNGCSYFTDTINVMLDMFEHTAALGDGDTALCNGNLLTLVNGAEAAVDYLWQDESTDPEILIESAGIYHVTVTNTLGCVARDTLDVSILGTVPDPAYSISGHCAEENISLLDESSSEDGTINAWEWSYNGTVFGTGEQVYISFPEAGQYDVSLEVFTDVGCHHHITQTLDVHPLPVPEFAPEFACSGQEILFRSLSSIPSDNLYQYRWQFGSGADWQESNEDNIIHTFNEAGEYSVTLVAVSDVECFDEITKTVNVKASPAANFTTAPACEGLPVNFWNQSQSEESPLWENQWDFGDGTNSGSSDPQHIYNGTGNFNVELVVKSLNGCTDTILKTVEVSVLPVAQVGSLDACLGVPHQLFDESTITSGSITSWEWQVDTLIFDEENPVLTLNDTTNLPLRLKVWSDAGCVSVIDSVLYVWENPVAGFELPQNWGAVPLELNMENTSEGAATYQWDFGDGEISSIAEPGHLWQNSGNYTIQLIAVNNKGCADTTETNLRVIIPLVDVAIIGLRTHMDGNYLVIEADIINPGTVPIENLALELNAGNGEIVREILQENFAEGSVMTYIFNTQPYIASGETPGYICVQLDPGETDETPENNVMCKMNSPEFSLFEMFPNPVNDILNMYVLLPSDGDLRVQVYDNTGKLVYNSETAMDSGYQRLQLNCSEFSSGRYQLRMSFGNEEILKGFVK